MSWRVNPRAWAGITLVALGCASLYASGCAKGAADDNGDETDTEVDASDPDVGSSTDARPKDAQAPKADATTGSDSAVPTDATASDASVSDASVVDATVSDASDASTGTCVKTAPSNVCGLNPQCGCAANQTCDVTNTTTGGVSCVSAGTATAGRSCTSTGNCAAGMTCWNGACHPYCTRGQATCGTGTICFAPQNASGAVTPNYDVCSVPCDVRSPATACGTNACVWFTAQKASDCRPAGTQSEFSSCTSTADCRQGLVCANDPTFGPTCVRYCRLGSNADCSLGDTCTDVYGANGPTAGATRLGACFF